MLKIALCDDNKEFLAQTEVLVQEWDRKPQGMVVRTFSEGALLLEAHKQECFDVILLDVLMPEMNGIETAKELRNLDKNVRIVFLTSSPEFAVDSYRVKAADYLLKPVRRKDLYQCLEEQLESLGREEKSIMVRCSGCNQRVELRDIEYLEAQNKHTLFQLKDGTELESLDPLLFFEERLTVDDGFFKCHRSYIVNIHHVEAYSSSEIKTEQGYRVPIARSVQKKFESVYFSVLFGK